MSLSIGIVVVVLECVDVELPLLPGNVTLGLCNCVFTLVFCDCVFILLLFDISLVDLFLALELECSLLCGILVVCFTFGFCFSEYIYDIIFLGSF